MAIESKSLETFKQCATAMAFLSKHMPGAILLTGEQIRQGVAEFCAESHVVKAAYKPHSVTAHISLHKLGAAVRGPSLESL